MPPLSVVVCPLPAARPAARLVSALLPALARNDGVVVFCPEPYQAPVSWTRQCPVLPLADLPHERGADRVAAPVFLLDGGPGDELLQRYREHVPGAAIDAATEPDGAALRALSAAVPAVPAVHARTGPVRVEAMVLTYRSKDYVDPCLQSLLAQDWPELTITVLDNASGDGTAEHVRRRFPTIEVLDAGSNLGFAAGHNVLFRRTHADYVALLNHDAVARRNWISELVTAAEARADGAVFGGKMLMRRCPTILNSTGIAMNESGFAADRDIGRPDLDPRTGVEPVFAVSGGAMLIRSSLLRQLGGFDPAFFMYVEDVDLCWRARLAGHQVYYVPTAVVVHDWHGDLAAAARPATTEPEAVVAEREGRRRFLVERNRLQAVIKNYELRRLVRVWRQLTRHDRGRIEALRTHVARGGGALPQRVLEAVEDAHRWCRRHAASLLWRRFRTQRLRTVPDAAFLQFVVPGMHEPSAVGDLHAIVDRHCARPRACIVMGSDDQGCLGPGWHHAEPGAGAGGAGLRWSMADCWFHLQRDDAPCRAITVHTAPQPLPGWAELQVDDTQLERLAVAPGVSQALRWELPAAVPPGQPLECRLRCQAFVPLQQGMGQDPRELGLHVLRIEAETGAPVDRQA